MGVSSAGRGLAMIPLSAATTQDVVVSNWGAGWTMVTHKQMNKHTLSDTDKGDLIHVRPNQKAK